MIDIYELAKKYGTPIFLIDLDKIKENFLRFKKAFPNSIIAYSYKTNFHPEILKTVNDIGGFAEVISPQEIYFAKKTGVAFNKIIYNGLGRDEEDFKKVISNGFFSINLNSIDELEKISKISKNLKKKVEIGIRINPSIKLEKKKSFTKDTKFGITPKDCGKVMKIINDNSFLKLKVIFADMGTNILNPQNYAETFKILDKLAENKIVYMDLGGGFASESVLSKNNKSISDFGEVINKINTKKYKLIFEPGRYLIEDACYCITKILSINNGWVITDIAGNFLIPLVNANYEITLPNGNYKYNFGGNSCFAADIIQKNVKTKKLNMGEILQINNSGAYTFSMRNNLAYPDPLILIKKNDEITEYKKKGSVETIFENMLKDKD